VALACELEPVGEVWADGDRLAQLCDNLISNAVKFTRAGGTVVVRLSRDDGALRLEVQDSGIGIPDHEQPQLFERFYRGSAAIRCEVPGTGLGLWISDAIVRMHDGTITVDSEVGVGTTFTVILPDAPAGAGPLPTRRGAP
jgi:hypothetical protein